MLIKIIKIGIVICLLLLIAVGATSTSVISDINTSMDDAISKLIDMGMRRFMSVDASMKSHELLIIL
jgi:hypothetical protein